MIEIIPNANFKSLFDDVHTYFSEEYKFYRECWFKYPASFVLREFPLHLDIEATSCCNLKCTFCDKLPLLEKSQLGFMDFNLFKKIIDEGADNRLWGVKLSYRGEPLLHPKIIDMIKYAKNKKIIDVYFNTNGMLLNEKMCQKIIDAGLDRISISVDGTDPVTFERERVGANYAVIIANIECLMNLKRKQNIDFPRVRVQTVQLPAVDLIEYKNYWMGRCDEAAVIDYKDSCSRNETMVSNWACPQLWQRMTIEWDGTIFACNNDDLRTLSVGNISNKSVFECWHDDFIKNVRRLHKEGKSHLVKDCNGCCWRTAQLAKKKG